MKFLVVNLLPPNPDDEKRLATRAAHLEYTKEHASEVVASGRLQSDDGATILGGFFVLDLPDRAAAEVWVENEPYLAAGIWKTELFAATT